MGEAGPDEGQYWDSITKEDLEFSVGTKANVWEVKEALLSDEDRRTMVYDTPGVGTSSDYGSSTYGHNPQRSSQYYSERSY